LEEVAVVRLFVSFLLVRFCRGIGVKIRSLGHFETAFGVCMRREEKTWRMGADITDFSMV